MALIQSDQLSQVQGGIGNQSVEGSGPSPLAGLVNSLGTSSASALNTLATTAVPDNAQRMVEEEVANFDAGVASAKQYADTDGSIAPKPDSVLMAEDEWNRLAVAVQTGSMTEDRAQMITAANLRKRIAKEPMFARQLRQAASGVLGFNIESIGAQRYFDAYPTRGELAKQDTGDTNKFLEGVDEEAEARAQHYGIGFDTARKTVLAEAIQKTELDALKVRRESGLITSGQEISELSKIDGEVAFTDIMGQIQLGIKNGEPLDNVAFGNMMMTKQQTFLNAMRQRYEGDINSPEFRRIEESINARYQGYSDLINAVGIDNMDKVGLERMETLRQQIADKMYQDVQIISLIGGQEYLSQYFKLNSGDLNETQRDQMMDAFPLLKRFDSIANASTEDLKRMTTSLYTKIIEEGEEPPEDTEEDSITPDPQDELSPEDGALLDVVAKNIMDNGDGNTQNSLINMLRKRGKTTKLNSLIFSKRPNSVSTEAIKGAKRDFDTQLPAVYQQIGVLMSTHPDAFEVRTKDNGQVSVVLKHDYSRNDNLPFEERKVGAKSTRREAMDVNSQIQTLVTKVNQFYKGLDNNWGGVFKTNKADMTLRATQGINSAKEEVLSIQGNRAAMARASTFQSHVLGGNYEDAKAIFDEIQAENPDSFSQPFDVLYEAVRRRSIEE